MNTRTLSRTFVSAQLNVGKQPDLDDLPEEAEHQVRFPLHQVWGVDVDHVAADGGGGVQGQVQIFLWGGEHQRDPVQTGATTPAHAEFIRPV